MKSKEEIINELPYFNGSSDFYIHNCLGNKFILTEGCVYIRENAGAYWLFDAIISYQPYKDVKAMEFQVWTLKRQGLADKSDKFILTLSDGNGNTIRTQKIPFSDFPLDEINFWLENNVIMLPTER